MKKAVFRQKYYGNPEDVVVIKDKVEEVKEEKEEKKKKKKVK